jgi:hypothetical protein
MCTNAELLCQHGVWKTLARRAGVMKRLLNLTGLEYEPFYAGRVLEKSHFYNSITLFKLPYNQ